MKFPITYLLIALLVGIHTTCCSETLEINCRPIPGAHYTIAKFDLNSRDSRLLGVPGYTWSYGCSPTSGTMVMAYYDRLPNTLYPNIYTGWTNNSIMPAYVCWGPGRPGSQSENPLCASHNGIDGYSGRGHVDDYWTDAPHPTIDPDPYITGIPPTIAPWTPHAPNNCVADFMGTSRSADNSMDGATHATFYTDGSAWDAPGFNICNGMREFFEYRGYWVAQSYNQMTTGTHGQTQTLGFAWEDFKDKIDNSYPVLLNVRGCDNANPPNYYGHTIVLIGYSTGLLGNDKYVYYRNTWDEALHRFDWVTGGVPYGNITMYPRTATVFVPAIITPPNQNIVLNYLDNDLYIQQYSSPVYTVTYSDESQNTYLDHCDWKINLYDENGIYTLVEGTTTGTTSSTWTPSIGSIPLGHTWRRNEDGSIQGDFLLSAIDNENYSHPLNRYIHLLYPPDAPQIVSVTQVDDALQFELGSDGATSYRVYYDTDAGVPYNGTGALEGQSPVFFNAWDDIKLTGLAPGMQWHIAIKAVNAAGESPISNEYLYTPANTSAIIDQNISWTNNLTLTHPVDIVSSGRLSISPNVVITLADEGRIICQADGVLQLNNYVTIKGQRLTIPQDETNPQEIPGNRVEVHGGLISGTGVSFDSFEGNYWDGLYIDSPYTAILNQMSFNNCRLVKEQETISINNSVFDNASISCRNASLIVDNCQISGEVYCLNSENINISNTSVTGYGNGIELSGCTNYEISNCQITNNTGNGINVYETNGAYNVIQRCTISMNAGDGIKFYHANGSILSCTINGNNKGVVVFQNSVVNINKEPGTDPNMFDSYISNNTWQEILFTNNCNVFMDGGWNQVLDMQYAQDTFDKYLVQCPNLNHSVNLRENYWGYHNGSVNQNPVLPPSERFYPENIISEEGEPGYILDPVWSPGLPHIITNENDELIYQQAVDLAVAEDAEGAIFLFKQIISLYPDSKLLDACANNLYALEQDKQALKDYYHAEPNLHWNGEIDKIADYLETYCNIKLGNYQEAIAWFESIISNPPSELDSLMAVIDLGYTYVLMQENAPKTAVTRMYPSLQPRSRKSFEQNRDALLVCLYTGATGNELPDTNFDNGIAVPMLNNCYPNPFNPTTTISYLLPYEMPCDLSIYNIRGQKVKTLVTDMQPAGLHKVVWDGTDRNGRIVSSGIYLYRLTSPVKSITNKMIMLK